MMSSCFSWAQNLNWVYFKDKSGVSFNPIEYFDIKAIERRVNTGINIMDSTDFPVSESYVSTIKKFSDSILYASRWLNALAVKTNRINEIEHLDFVKKVEKIESDFYTCSSGYDTSLTVIQKHLLKKQLSHMEINYFHRNNYYGQNVRIAVFDAGFSKADVNPVFKYLFDSHRILAVYNFAKKNKNVYKYDSHGTAVLSCIAGEIGGYNMGAAPKASFLLAKTEVKREAKADEVNWIAALEWADKKGAQIINSSLGYTYHRYFPEDMNGKTSAVAIAANLAAKKGLLIINSVGNNAENEWRILSTPADADSVLAVGGIDPMTGIHSRFSSLGPSADFRVKPNVCASGKAIVAGQNELKIMKGTSVSAALVTGFAACVWQMHPEYSNMDVFREIEKSASLYPYFDYMHSYGVPKATYFFSSTIYKPQKSFIVSKKRTKLIIKFTEKAQRRNKNDYVYYHIADKQKILNYFVIARDGADKIEINTNNIEGRYIIRIFYQGSFKEFKLSNL